MPLPKLPLALLILTLTASAAQAQWVWTPETGRFINLRNLPKETPELQIEYARSLMVEGNFRQAVRETNKFKDFYGDSELADENQFLRGEIEMAREEYVDAARQFQQVVDTYPDTDLYGRVIELQYEIGDQLYEKGVARRETERWYHWFAFWRNRPLRDAIEVYRMVKSNQPFTPAAAEAQYKIGRAYYAREEYIEATFEYQILLEQYPDSEWVDEASIGLIESYREQTLDPIYDQAPAELAIDAIDSHMLRFPSEPRAAEFQDLKQQMREQIAEQRYLTAKFYEKRQQWPSVRIYYNVILSEYPDTAAAEKAREGMEALPVTHALYSEFLRLQ